MWRWVSILQSLFRLLILFLWHQNVLSFTFTGGVNVNVGTVSIVFPLSRTRCPVPSWMDPFLEPEPECLLLWKQFRKQESAGGQMLLTSALWTLIVGHWVQCFHRHDLGPSKKLLSPLKIHWRDHSTGILRNFQGTERGVLLPTAQITWALPLQYPGLISHPWPLENLNIRVLTLSCPLVTGESLGLSLSFLSVSFL